MSAKTKDVEAAIKYANELVEDYGGHIGAVVSTILASHAAQAEEIAAQSRLITEQDDGLAKYEDALVSQTALIRSQAERIASLEAGVRLIRATAQGDGHALNLIAKACDNLLSGKASAC